MWTTALLIGAAILGAPTPAHAAYNVQVYDDGVLQTVNLNGANPGAAINVFTAGNSLVFFGATTNFSISNGSGLSNNPGTNGSGNLDLSSNEQITTTFGAGGGTHTIQIVLSQTDWNTPTGSPLSLTSSAGGSAAYIAGTAPLATQTISATYQGFLDNTNTLFGQPAAGSTPIQSASVTLNTPGTAPLVFTPGTAGNNTVPGGTPFSLTDVLSFTFALDAGSGQATANVSASTVASVPAPAGVVLALAGLPCLGIGTWLKRRRQTVAAHV